MVETDAVAIELNDILTKQNGLLTEMLTEQRLIRETVTVRSWERLDAALYRIQKLGEEFSELEKTRVEKIRAFTGNENLDIYQIAHMFSPNLRQMLLESFRMMRQKLAVSKIENNSLSEYVRVAKKFLQEVLDTSVPQAGTTVYTNKGKVVKTAPGSMILDQVI